MMVGVGKVGNRVREAVPAEAVAVARALRRRRRGFVSTNLVGRGRGEEGRVRNCWFRGRGGGGFRSGCLSVGVARFFLPERVRKGCFESTSGFALWRRERRGGRRGIRG